MKIKNTLMTGLLASISMTAMAAEPVKLESMVDRSSYGAGYQYGQSLSNAPIQPNADALILGIRDAISKKDPRLTKEQLQAAFKEMGEEMKAKADQMAKVDLQKGQSFLEANKKKTGVKTTASGLQYKVLTAAPEGAKKPKASDSVTVHYRGTLISGKEFDSSYKRNQPATFGVGQVIKGWTEALQMMGEGAKWQLVIPSELAYGKIARPNIPANSVLLFDVELLKVNDSGDK